jgi:hypothetical protein
MLIVSVRPMDREVWMCTLVTLAMAVVVQRLLTHRLTSIVGPRALVVCGSAVRDGE